MDTEKIPSPKCDLQPSTYTNTYPANYANRTVMDDAETAHGCGPCKLRNTKYCGPRTRITDTLVSANGREATVTATVTPTMVDQR